MKDTFFYNIYIDIFRDGIGGKIIGFFIWAASLFFIFLLLGLIYVGVDSTGEEKYGTAVVIGKYYKESYNSISYVSNGKTMMPVNTHHPETFNIQLIVEGKQAEDETYETMYNSINTGDTLNVTYSLGVLSGEIYVNINSK
jgi:hypothetical protein